MISSVGVSHVSHQPTRGDDRTADKPSSCALRNRSREGSASLERSKSPQCSQASNIIRRKYSQLRTHRPSEQSRTFAERIDSPER